MKKIISAILSLIIFCSATVYCSFAEENDTKVQFNSSNAAIKPSENKFKINEPFLSYIKKIAQIIYVCGIYFLAKKLIVMATNNSANAAQETCLQNVKNACEKRNGRTFEDCYYFMSRTVCGVNA